MTIKVNGYEADPGCYGRDWESILAQFDLEIPKDEFVVGATMTIRHVGSLGDAPRQPAPWRPAELGYPYPDLVIPYEFASLWAKQLVMRNYRLARFNGCTRPAAKWVAVNECQRLMNVEAPFLATRFKDTRADYEIESENAYLAESILNNVTVVEPDEGLTAWWEWNDGELWLQVEDDEYEGE